MVSFQIVQRFQLHAEFWLPWHPNRKNFKNLLVKNYFPQFKNNLAQMVFYQVVKIILICQKTWLPGGKVSFFLYTHRGNLKNLLVKYY